MSATMSQFTGNSAVYLKFIKSNKKKPLKRGIIDHLGKNSTDGFSHKASVMREVCRYQNTIFDTLKIVIHHIYHNIFFIMEKVVFYVTKY